MNNNVRIARKLIRIARMLVASNERDVSLTFEVSCRPSPTGLLVTGISCVSGAELIDGVKSISVIDSGEFEQSVVRQWTKNASRVSYDEDAASPEDQTVEITATYNGQYTPGTPVSTGHRDPADDYPGDSCEFIWTKADVRVGPCGQELSKLLNSQDVLDGLKKALSDQDVVVFDLEEIDDYFKEQDARYVYYDRQEQESMR